MTSASVLRAPDSTSPATLPWIWPPKPSRIWPTSPLYRRLLADPTWIAEPKKSGDRCLVYVEDRNVSIWTRHRRPARLPAPAVTFALRQAAKLGRLPDRTIFDGELMQADRLWLFDVVCLDGEWLAGEPWTRRHGRLVAEVPGAFDADQPVFLLPCFVGTDKAGAYERCVEAGDEGVVFKQVASPYRVQRSETNTEITDWLKCRHNRQAGG